jgi:hypothetical protein
VFEIHNIIYFRILYTLKAIVKQVGSAVLLRRRSRRLGTPWAFAQGKEEKGISSLVVSGAQYGGTGTTRHSDRPALESQIVPPP